jgi:hypothetical protein
MDDYLILAASVVIGYVMISGTVGKLHESLTHFEKDPISNLPHQRLLDLDLASILSTPIRSFSYQIVYYIGWTK